MDIIKSSADISSLFQNGRRIHTPYATLIVQKQCDRSSSMDGRVAFIAGKKLGNAVWRNKAKRRMRALCYENGGPVAGYDVIFLAKAKVNDAPYEKMLSSVKRAFGQIQDN